MKQLLNKGVSNSRAGADYMYQARMTRPLFNNPYAVLRFRIRKPHFKKTSPCKKTIHR